LFRDEIADRRGHDNRVRDREVRVGRGVHESSGDQLGKVVLRWRHETKRATGRPRSVTMTSSPRCTRRTYSLKRC
jgi:hypothetical protein